MKMNILERLKSARGPDRELDYLRDAAHNAPLNKVFTDHKGRRFLGSHSMAWAKASSALFTALQAKDKQDA